MLIKNSQILIKFDSLQRSNKRKTTLKLNNLNLFEFGKDHHQHQDETNTSAKLGVRFDTTFTK